jgi:HSP20 family protein
MRRTWPPSYFPARAAFPDPARIRQDIDRLFDLIEAGTPSSAVAGVYPAMNVTQDGQNFYVRSELPGINPSELEIAMERNKLVVSGKREIPVERDNVSYHRRERAGGSFNRSIALPAEIDAERVEAAYRHGILTITLPKAEAVKARKITVRS